MITYDLKRGDLLRNKITGDIAILRGKPFTRFYHDITHPASAREESGTAETCYPLIFTVVQGSDQTGIGTKINVRQSSLKRNWERVCK